MKRIFLLIFCTLQVTNTCQQGFVFPQLNEVAINGVRNTINHLLYEPLSYELTPENRELLTLMVNLLDIRFTAQAEIFEHRYKKLNKLYRKAFNTNKFDRCFVYKREASLLIDDVEEFAEEIQSSLYTTYHTIRNYQSQQLRTDMLREKMRSLHTRS